MTRPPLDLEAMRERVALAEASLREAVRSNCPGEHLPVQHRDGKRPWCKACGRTDRGERQESLMDRRS